MASVFSAVSHFGPARVVAEAILLTIATIALLLAFILVRRGWRSRFFRRRDDRVLAIRAEWDRILSGEIPPAAWREDPLSCAVVESILLDRLEVTFGEEAETLVRCLRTSGLLDLRISDARRSRGFRRRHALVSLGRMRAPEAVPALAEALDDRRRAHVLTAVRGLGRLGLPQAALPLLERLTSGQLSSLPPIPVQNALLNCCRPCPEILMPFIRRADATTRPLLARVLGEVATGHLEEDLVLLASDEQAEVRASAARALAGSSVTVALSTLGVLAEDEEWFVRLRAVVALGDLEHPQTIPFLVERLCDANRFVRLRAASGLARLDDHVEEILDLVVAKHDRYALQALLSELEISGAIPLRIERLATATGSERRRAERLLLRVLELGSQRLLVSSLSGHRDRRVRFRVARLLAGSQASALVPLLERAAANEPSHRRRQVIVWVLAHLSVPAGKKARRRRAPVA